MLRWLTGVVPFEHRSTTIPSTVGSPAVIDLLARRRLDRPDETASGAVPRRPGRRSWLFWLFVAAVTLSGLCVAGVPLAPVERTTASIDWPGRGRPVESTMLSLVPYRPLALSVVVPCRAPGTDAPAAGAVLFSTYPVGTAEDGRGLTVRTRPGGTLEVVSEGLVMWAGEIAARSCSLQVEVDGDSTAVLLDGAPVAERALEPPRVASLATQLPTGTPGLSARLQADSRFETSPTTVKALLLALSVLGAGLALAGLALVDRRGARSAEAPRSRGAVLQDLSVLVGLVTWAFLGPATSDDGYNIAAVQNSGLTGYIGNYYHWYNAPEAPFALVQQLLAPLVALTQAPVLLRVPAVLAGAATWLLISRVLLPRLSGQLSVSAARWLAVPVFLGWWFPFNNSLRPEPYIALASAAVLALVLLALERERLLLLGLAGVVTATSFALAPSGVMAAAPFLVLAPRLLGLLRSAPVFAPLLAAAIVMPGAAVAGLAAFADQPLSAVLEATRMHRVIGPSEPWWRDYMRYEFLFEDSGEMGSFGRRLAVLIAFSCLLLVLALRRPLGELGSGLLLSAAGSYGLALLALVLSPSKWTHHFGGAVPFAVLLIVGVALHTPAALRSERGALRLSLLASGLTAGVVSAGLAGPNIWWMYGALGIDPVLPSFLGQPLLWLAAAGFVLVGLRLASRRSPSLSTALPAVPGTVLVLGLAASALIAVGSHARSAQAATGGWSMLSENVGHLTGDDCGMADHLEVLSPSRLVPAPELGPEQQTRPGAFDRRRGTVVDRPASLPPDFQRWGSLGTLPGDPEAVTGRLTTSWFAVPALSGDQSVGVVVSGRSGGENSVVLEFADRDATSTVLKRLPVAVGLDSVNWQQVALPSPLEAPGELVRVVATDADAARGGWLGVSEPVLVTPTPLREVVGQRTVHVDWPIRLAFPCLPQVTVAHGLARQPDLVLTVAPRETADSATALAFEENPGGTLAMARQASTREVLPTRLPFVSEDNVLRGLDLGTLSLYTYPYPQDRFELSLGTETVRGWEWGYRYPVPVEREPLDPPGPPLIDKGPGTEPQIDPRPELAPPDLALGG